MGLFVTIKWKNRSWKTAFSGDITVYMRDKGIKVKRIKHPRIEGVFMLRYKIPVGSENATYESMEGNEWASHRKAVQIYLTILGDESKIITSYGTFNIN